MTLLPKNAPVHLYTFTPRFAAASDVGSLPKGRVSVRLEHGSFDAAAEDDRLLTYDGAKAAYIADSRWVAPASVAFNEAVAAAFSRRATRARLVFPGQQTREAQSLRLDVRNFETRYDHGLGQAPLIVVRVKAQLSGPVPTAVEEHVFEAAIPATGNRVSLIVEAYRQAVSRVLSDLVAWTDARL